jgi:hypothetical protein
VYYLLDFLAMNCFDSANGKIKTAPAQKAASGSSIYPEILPKPKIRSSQISQKKNVPRYRQEDRKSMERLGKSRFKVKGSRLTS